MGGPDKVNAQETTEQQMTAFIRNLGPLMEVVSKNILPAEQALQDSRNAISPQQSQLELDLFEQFGPLLNEIGSNIAEQNAKRQVQIDTDIAEDRGRDLVAAAQQLARDADPEFFDNREAASDSFLQLLESLDPNGLSGSEEAGVERGVNRTLNRDGDRNTGSSGASLKSALSFDDRLLKKKQTLGAVLNTFPAVQQGSRSGIDTFQLTTGRPSMPSFSQFNPTGSRETGGLTTQFGSQFLGETGSNARQANDINSRRKDGFEKFGQVAAGIGNIGRAASGAGDLGFGF
jgi:hypothetical protein